MGKKETLDKQSELQTERLLEVSPGVTREGMIYLKEHLREPVIDTYNYCSKVGELSADRALCDQMCQTEYSKEDGSRKLEADIDEAARMKQRLETLCYGSPPGSVLHTLASAYLPHAAVYQKILRTYAKNKKI